MSTTIVPKSGIFTIADADIGAGDDSVTYRCTGAFAITIPSTGVTAGNIFVIQSIDGLQTFTTAGATVNLPQDKNLVSYGTNATIVTTCISTGVYDITGDLQSSLAGSTSIKQVKTKLYEEILAVDGIFDIQNISQGYGDLYIELLDARTTEAATGYDNIRMYINNDIISTNYKSATIYGAGSVGLYPINDAIIGQASTNASLASYYGNLYINIKGYTENRYKLCDSTSFAGRESPTNLSVNITNMFWQNVSSINRITIRPTLDAENFIANTAIVIYGVRNEVVGDSISATQTGVVGHLRADYTTVTTITALTPWDNTIPQNTEGQEITTILYTPKYANSILHVQAVMWGSWEQDTVAMALFRDSNAGADAVSMSYGSIMYSSAFVDFEYTSNSTIATTFKLRMGVGSGTAYINADAAGAPVYGGKANSFIKVTEIKV